MKQTITKKQFIDTFQSWETRKDQFSEEALSTIYDFITEYERDAGEETELDVVGICCDFTEYASLDEMNGELGTEYKDVEEASHYYTLVATTDSGSIVASAQ